jgi:hypothetical protein
MPGLFDRLQEEIAKRDAEAGVSPLDLLDMSPELQRLMQRLARRGARTSAALAQELALPPDEVERLLAELVAKGFARVVEPAAGTEEDPAAAGATRYQAAFGRRRRRELPLGIWEALAAKTEPPEPDG